MEMDIPGSYDRAEGQNVFPLTELNKYNETNMKHI